jgi:hypothetical protein
VDLVKWSDVVGEVVGAEPAKLESVRELDVPAAEPNGTRDAGVPSRAESEMMVEIAVGRDRGNFAIEDVELDVEASDGRRTTPTDGGTALGPDDRLAILVAGQSYGSIEVGDETRAHGESRHPRRRSQPGPRTDVGSSTEESGLDEMVDEGRGSGVARLGRGSEPQFVVIRRDDVVVAVDDRAVAEHERAELAEAGVYRL